MEGSCTIKKIAEELGIAHSTVSRVLNDAPSAKIVSKATRDRIKEAVARLGYVPNVNARRLIKSRSSVVGIVLPADDMAFPARASIADRMLGDAMAGMAEVFKRHEFRMLLIFNDERFVSRREYITLFKERALDGMIVWGARNCESYWNEAADLNVVMINSRNGADGATSYIGGDNRRAAYESCRRLLSKGHRKIAYLDCYEGLSISDERFSGYRDALEEAGIPFSEKLCFRDGDFGRCFERFFAFQSKAPEGFDAIQCVNNGLAFACGRELKRRGRLAADEVCIAGGDCIDDPCSLPFVPSIPMFSFRPPCRKMGALAAEWAVEGALGGGASSPRSLLLPVEMLEPMYETKAS